MDDSAAFFAHAEFLIPGTVVDDRYRVERLLGTGGMGWVVLASDLKLDSHPVALKILLPHLVANDNSYARFSQEILLSMRLSHPHIVQTYRSGSLGRLTYYLAMEYVDGESLRSFLDREYAQAKGQSPVSIDVLSPLLREISAGITYAHSMGLVHRDVKPDNVLLDAGRKVKIADFGIAQVLRQESRVTRVGDLLGTPRYMSPEQFRSEMIDARSDIYAFGVLAYELCCGTPPYDADNIFALAEAHCNGSIPRVRSRRADIPEWLDNLIDNCLQKDRNSRVQSMQEVYATIAEATGCTENLINSDARATVAIELPESNPLLIRLFRLVNAFFPIIILGALILVVAHFSAREAGMNTFISRHVLTLELSTGERFPTLRRIFEVHLELNDVNALSAPESPGAAELLLELGADPNQIEPSSKLPLLHFWAGQSNDSRAPVLKSLLHSGANPHIVDYKGKTPLHYAIETGTERAVEILIEAGISLERPRPDGSRPLLLATSLRRNRVVQLLLDANANPNSTSSTGETALHIAVRDGNIEAARALVAAGADPRLRTQTGISSIELLQQKARTAEETQLLDRLLKHPAP